MAAWACADGAVARCPLGSVLYLRTRKHYREGKSATLMRHDALQPAAMDSSEPIDLELALRFGGARTWLLKILEEDIKII